MSKEGQNRQGSNKMDKLEDVAAFYGYSSRRLRDQIVKGEIVGVEHDYGSINYFTSGEYVMRGPLPDAPKEYTLPEGTKMVSHSVCSGEVKGAIFQGELRMVKHPTITLMAETGHSGIIVELTCLS